MRNKLLIVLLVVVVAASYLAVRQLTAPKVYTIYLPAIYAPFKPLRGVGQTGPHDVSQLGEWHYNWMWRPYDGVLDPRFVPMIRDIRRLSELPQAVEYAQASGYLMGLNEPDKDEPYGYPTTPEQGAEAWREIERQAVGIKLVSPAPSQDDFDWLWRMVTAYEKRYGEKPRFDAIACHWYNYQNPGTVQPAKDFLLRVRREALAHGYDCPLWLTEFAGHPQHTDPTGGHERLMKELIPWMEQQTWIGRYAWFASLVRPVEPWCTGCDGLSLTYEDGRLTPLGEVYR